MNVFLWGKIASELGTSKFGTFSYFQAILFIIAPFWSLGINQIIRNKISIFQKKSHEYISAGIFIKFTMTCILALFSIIYIQFKSFDVSHGTLLFYLFFASYFFRSVDIIEFNFDSKTQSIIPGMIRTFAFIATTISYIVALIFNLDLHWFAFIFSMEFLISGILLVYCYLKIEKKALVFKTSLQTTLEILRPSIPILLCDISISLFLRINHVFLGEILSKESVGQFSVALRLTEVWYFIPSSIIITMFAPLSQIHERSKVEFEKIVTSMFEIMLILSLLITISVFIFSKMVITLLYGSAYISAVPILKVLILSNLFMFWGVVQEPIDISKNILKWRLFRVFTGTLLNLGLCSVLIKYFGTIGAAYATFVTFFYAYFFSNLIYPKGREIFFMQLRSLLLMNTLSFAKNKISEIRLKRTNSIKDVKIL